MSFFLPSIPVGSVPPVVDQVTKTHRRRFLSAGERGQRRVCYWVYNEAVCDFVTHSAKHWCDPACELVCAKEVLHRVHFPGPSRCCCCCSTLLSLFTKLFPYARDLFRHSAEVRHFLGSFQSLFRQSTRASQHHVFHVFVFFTTHSSAYSVFHLPYFLLVFLKLHRMSNSESPVAFLLIPRYLRVLLFVNSSFPINLLIFLCSIF